MSSLADRLDDGPVFAPLCLDALTARMIDELGYGAAYLSGGALGYSMAVSEALLTLTELAATARNIVQRSSVPLIVDGGVGFGDPVHATRMMWEFESAGVAAIELEDQVVPKRASHHRGVEHLISTDEMTAKIAAVVDARKGDTLLIARTGAVKNESFDAAIGRCRAYRDAGADLLMLFPGSIDEWRQARRLLDGIPLAGMAPFGSRSKEEWAEVGWDLLIDPFTGQVLAYEAIRDAYRGYQSGEGIGRRTKELYALYEELPQVAGMDQLYDIERATTEKDQG